MSNKYIYLKLVTIVIITITCFTTCKKYPEDPFISLRTVKQRMTGEWQFEGLEINGEDVIYKYNDSLAPLSLNDFYFWFKFDLKNYGGGGKIPLLFVNKSTKNAHDAEDADVCGIGFVIQPKKSKKFYITGSWEYVVNKDPFSSKLIINLWGAGHDWNIKKLYKNKMVMQKEINGNTHRLYLKKIRS